MDKRWSGYTTLRNYYSDKVITAGNKYRSDYQNWRNPKFVFAGSLVLSEDYKVFYVTPNSNRPISIPESLQSIDKKLIYPQWLNKVEIEWSIKHQHFDIDWDHAGIRPWYGKGMWSIEFWKVLLRDMIIFERDTKLQLLIDKNKLNDEHEWIATPGRSWDYK